MAKPIVDLDAATRKKQRELASLLGLLKQQCMEAGLLLTFHKLELGLVMIGHEIAAMETGTWPQSAIYAFQERFKEQFDGEKEKDRDQHGSTVRRQPNKRRPRRRADR